MSDSQAYEEVTVASEGVTVVKRFEEDEFPVPAIAFEFESARDEDVTVRMSDSVPEGIEVEDLGFHPEYGSEFWTIDDETITFEREIEAGGSYTTVYGIRATGSDNVQQFLTEPVIEEVDPPLPEGESAGDVIPESDDDVVKDAIAGDGEIPGLEDDEEESEESDEDVTLNLNDPNNEGAPQAQDGDTAGEGETTESDDGGDSSGGGGGGSVAIENGSLAGALANEIREQNVSGEDLKLLRRALDVAAKNDGVNEARIEQLQSDISDLRAYTGALEEFLDENGTGDEMIQEFETQLDSFDERLQSVQSEIQSNSEQVESVSEEVSSMSETVSQVDEEMDSLSEEVDSVSGEVGSVREDVDNVGSGLDSLENSVEELEGQVQELEEKVTEGDIAQEVEDIQQEIDDLQTWQEQIKETFGG